MPTPPPTKQKVQQIVDVYIRNRGPERALNKMGPICGYASGGKNLKDLLEKWAPFYNIIIPPRVFDNMTNFQRLLIEKQCGSFEGEAVVEEFPDEEPRKSFPIPPAFARGGEMPVYVSRPDNTFVFGVTSDNHLGSKYERLDVLNDLYDKFALAGVDRVFNAGNWIDGYKTGINEHDVHTPHMEPQLRYFAKNYPQRQGITTYAVTGEDHEGWWARSMGIDIGARAEQTMRECGRTDWVDLGFMEAHVRLVNYNTGKEQILAVVHPGGGTAYALSYSIQKIIESLEGGEKPAVALYGHYHKLGKFNVRNVWCIMTGCTQDQTTFMRNKVRQETHVGGLIVALDQDPETGAIIGCGDKMMRYFVTSFYNNRWSKAHLPNLPTRDVQQR